EMTVIDLRRKARVSSAEILGGQQKLFRFGAGIADARHAQEHETTKRARPARNVDARPASKGVSRHALSSRILGPARKSGIFRASRKSLGHCRTAARRDQVSWQTRADSRWLIVAFQARGKEAIHAAPLR